MGGRNRWSHHQFDGPATGGPNDPKCEECTEPSHTYHIGAKTVEGVVITRFVCANDHRWTRRSGEEKRSEQPT